MKTLLVVAYLSLTGVPHMEIHEWKQDLKSCRKAAMLIYNNVRAGSVRAWCDQVPIPPSQEQKK